MRLVLLFVFAVLSASAQTSLDAPAGHLAAISNSLAEGFQTQTNQGLSPMQRYQNTRMECIPARRIICGKIQNATRWNFNQSEPPNAPKQ